MARRSQLAARALVVAAAFLAASSCQEDESGPTAPVAGAPSRAGGDLATDPPPDAPGTLVGAGDIASCTTLNDESTATLLDGIPGTVFTIGDNAYNDGSAADFANCYEPSWGRHKARTRPSVGDRDYHTTDAAAYFAYFGAAAGEPGKGYYSYDVGDWHVVVLNSHILMVKGSPQEQWLRADLAASTKPCTVAIWHHARYVSADPVIRPKLKAVWDDLYAVGAELVVNGHNKFYERFRPMAPDDAADAEYGIRQIIAGIGGGGTSAFGPTLAPNSEARNSGAKGVLKLTLHADRYDWELVPGAGKTFTDAGSDGCHGPPPPAARAGGPYAGDGSVRFSGTASFDPQGNTPLAYAWDFGDGTTGTGATPTHEYADGSYLATLLVTDATGAVSRPSTAAVTVANLPPAVSAGPELSATTGIPVTLSVRFSDPGTGDAPWGYEIDWGDGAAPATGSVDVQTASIAGSHAYASAGSYVIRATVTDKDGGIGSDEVTVSVAQGSIPSQVFVGAGNIAKCTNTRDEATAQLITTALEGVPGAVFTAGDNAFPSGTYADYVNCYEPSWGRHKARTYPVLGNHEYDTGTADGSYDYFGAVLPRDKGYYSFDLGDWHIIVLNDNPTHVPIKAGSEQEQWLRADLAASAKTCTLALWHAPLYLSSNTAGYTANPSRKAFWDALYAAGADVVVNGQEHHYERLLPMRPDGTVDETTGIRSFIVGTGGESMSPPPTVIHPGSDVRGIDYGVLKLTLAANGYTWEFVGIPGSTFTDTGSGTCR